MAARPASLWPVLLVVFAAFAGCTAKDPAALVKNFEAVPANASHEVGKGDFALRIRVVGEVGSGPPVPGATVLIFPIAKPITPPSINQLRTMNATYGARTDANGEIVAHLNGGKTYSFLATSPNHTVEGRHLIKMGSIYNAEPLLIVLLNNTKTLELQGKFPAGATATRFPACGGTLCQGKATAQQIPALFHEDPRTNREYTSRISRAESTLRWENLAGEFGDLGSRVGFSDQLWWQTDVPSATPGASVETVRVEHAQLKIGSAKKDPAFYAAAMTYYPVVTVDGLDYGITLVAQFSTDPVTEGYHYNPEPGFELVFATLGLLGAGFWVRRRRA